MKISANPCALPSLANGTVARGARNIRCSFAKREYPWPRLPFHLPRLLLRDLLDTGDDLAPREVVRIACARPRPAGSHPEELEEPATRLRTGGGDDGRHRGALGGKASALRDSYGNRSVLENETVGY